MKKIHSVIILPVLIIFLLVSPVIGSDDWMINYEDMNGDVILYKIEHRIKNIVQVWGNRILSDEGREEFIRDRRDNGLSTEGLDKLGHVTSLYEINCRQKTGRLLSVVMYDRYGVIIYSGSSVEPEWDYIVPNTDGDTFRKKVCE